VVFFWKSTFLNPFLVLSPKKRFLDRFEKILERLVQIEEKKSAKNGTCRIFLKISAKF